MTYLGFLLIYVISLPFPRTPFPNLPTTLAKLLCYSSIRLTSKMFAPDPLAILYILEGSNYFLQSSSSSVIESNMQIDFYNFFIFSFSLFLSIKFAPIPGIILMKLLMDPNFKID